MFLRALVILMLAVVPTAASQAGKPKDYDGADAGYLVYAVGVVRLPAAFEFPYGRVATSDGGPVDDWKGLIEPKLGGAFYLKVKNPDFDKEETGHVVVRRLPPGRYQVRSFRFFGQIPGIASYSWKPTQSFALPFDIRSGEATYIGSFSRAMATAAMRPDIGGGPYFVIANRAQRDLPIAMSRLPSMMKITQQVTDVRQFGLRSLEPDILREPALTAP
jgi:hypothetical protein